MCKRKCSDCGHYMSWVNLGMWGCNVNGNLDDPDNCDMYDSNPISEPIDTYCTTEDIKSLDDESNESTSGSYLEFEKWMLDMRDPQRNMLKTLEKIKKEKSDKNFIILKGRQQR